MLLSSADFFKIDFYKKFFQEHYQSVKGQDWCSVGPDLGPNCLQRLSADNSKERPNSHTNRINPYQTSSSLLIWVYTILVVDLCQNI